MEPVMKSITNYRDELLSFSKEELIKMIPLHSSLIEKMEIEGFGGRHLSDFNGPDGIIDDCGTILEHKSQTYTENFTLRGRAKFGSPTEKLLEEKIKSNETIIVSGHCEATGDIYYRFKFTFDAIAKDYSWSIGQSCYNCIPPHYIFHPSFSVEYLAPVSLLDKKEREFQPKFFRYLQHLHGYDRNPYQVIDFTGNVSH